MKFLHCPLCGEKLVPKNIGDEGLVPFCSTCDRPMFNIPYTCTLTLVVNEFDEVALIRQNYVSQSNYVLVAGYIKSGESAEETAMREAQEEIGVSVKTVRYLKSYCYEKRDMLMLGFIAAAEKCDLSISREVDEAGWFPIEEALTLLKEGSIAMQLLEDYLEDK
ncbi:MAG TPA: NUDIX domain-containing protein [Mobilitalea sp.]|nr:NUDIX domain-containing protein [Mobilitalea sp.]